MSSCGNGLEASKSLKETVRTRSQTQEWLTLPLNIIRVKGAQFTDGQIKRLIARTNRKLSNAKIRIKPSSVFNLNEPKLSKVSEGNIVQLLEKTFDLENKLRLILVQEDVSFGNGSWTL